MKTEKKLTNGYKGSFTLIELLVVIAIIAILASMLLPALNKARLKAKEAECVSKLKTLGLQLGFYCDDNKDFMFKASGTGNTWYSYGNDPNFVKNYLRLKWEASNAYLQKPNPMYCPAHLKGVSAGLSHVSYAYNVHPTLAPATAAASGQVKRSQVKNTSSLLVFTDMWGDYNVGSSTTWLATRWTDLQYGIWFGHSQKANIAFLDGHVEGLTRSKVSDNNLYVKF